MNCFREKLTVLEDKLYIKKIASSFGEKFGGYKITPEEIKYLISIERKK